MLKKEILEYFLSNWIFFPQLYSICNTEMITEEIHCLYNIALIKQ